MKAIADVLRPYGIRVVLSANFASPMVIGGLKDADPLKTEVAAWWRDRAEKVYFGDEPLYIWAVIRVIVKEDEQ